MVSKLLLLCSLLVLAGIGAKADTLVPCSPNCTLADAGDLLLAAPPTYTTYVAAYAEDTSTMPTGLWSYEVGYSSLLIDPQVISFDFAAYALDSVLPLNLLQTERYALLDWVALVNDPPPDSSHTPEPSTLLLLGTGFLGTPLLLKRRHFLSTMMSSK